MQNKKFKKWEDNVCDLNRLKVHVDKVRINNNVFIVQVKVI